MTNWVEADRKQVFGVAEIDDSYLKKIKTLLDARIQELTAATYGRSP